MRTVRDRPTLLQRWPNGVGGQNFFQKRIPDSAPRVAADDDRRHRQRHRVAGHRDGRRGPRAVGGQPGLSRLPPVAVPGGHPGGHRRAADRSRPVARDDVRDGARGRRRGARLPRRARHHRLPQDDGEPWPAPLRARRTWLGLLWRAAGGGERRPGDGGAATRSDHGEVVEGGARCPRLHRLQPERPAQDGVRGLVRASPPGRPGVGAVPLGRAAGDPSGSPDDGDGARPARRRRRPVGGHRRPNRSPSSRSSPATATTSPEGSPTPRGRRSTPRCPTRPAA